MQAFALGDDIYWCIWRQGFLQCSLKPSATEVVRCFINAHVYFDVYGDVYVYADVYADVYGDVHTDVYGDVYADVFNV